MIKFSEIISIEIKSLSAKYGKNIKGYTIQRDKLLRSFKYYPCEQCLSPMDYIKKELKCLNCGADYSID